VPDAADPYWKLRPEPATPADELCSCQDTPPLVLQEHLSSLPIVCLRCNGEVLPESIGFPTQLAEDVASWRRFYGALMTLWLDSGEYESWAPGELQRPDGPANVGGLKAVAELNKHRRTYFWWFQDVSAHGFLQASSCPLCGRALVESFGKLVCNPCSVVVPNG